MIRLFATDLDNTLLVDKKIPDENISALKKLIDCGVTVCLISGRTLSSIRYLADEADIDCAKIGSNGAVGDDVDGKNFVSRELSDETVLKLIEIGEEYNVFFHFYDYTDYYSPFMKPDYYSHLLVSEENIGNRYQCGFHIIPEIRDVIGKAKVMKFQYIVPENLEEEIYGKVKSIPGISITYSDKGLLEIMADGVNKWSALKTFGEIKGIKQEEMCACGDYLNDIEMIKNAGVGVAVGNASDEVKEKADYVAKPFYEYGIADAVNHLFETGKIK